MRRGIFHPRRFVISCSIYIFDGVTKTEKKSLKRVKKMYRVRTYGNQPALLAKRNNSIKLKTFFFLENWCLPPCVIQWNTLFYLRLNRKTKTITKKNLFTDFSLQSFLFSFSAKIIIKTRINYSVIFIALNIEINCIEENEIPFLFFYLFRF